MGCPSSKVAPTREYFASNLPAKLPTQEEKLQRLKTLDPFVLDNSIRESTVVQPRGHVASDKEAILAAIEQTGISHVLVGAFGKLLRVDDVWLQDLQNQGRIKDLWYVFSEARESWDAKGIPLSGPPLGLRKARQYGIRNVVIELDLNCQITDFGSFNFIEFLIEHITWVRNELSPDSHIFINYRDAVTSWASKDARERMLLLTECLARHTPRIFGILFEDPEGTCFPWELTEFVWTLRSIMDRCGWLEAHFLCHIHKKYQLAEACVLECLASGCNGIWCAASEEGAGVGHASSLGTLVNLKRLGNPHVDKYDLRKLRRAAIVVTERSTGSPPAPKLELIGERALDVLWGETGMGGGQGTPQFDLAEVFNVQRAIRVTTFTDAGMFTDALDQCFGKRDWPQSVVGKMQQTIRADLIKGDKWQYITKAALFDLYQRSGGGDFLEDMGRIVLDSGTVDENHHLMRALLEHCKFWSGMDVFDGKLTRHAFHAAFLSVCFEHDTHPLVIKILSRMDLDADGCVSWSEVSLRGLWILDEYPDQQSNWDFSAFLSILINRSLLVYAAL